MNVLGSRYLYSIYFIAFVIVIGYFAVNVIVSLILSGVSQLQLRLKQAATEAQMVNSQHEIKLAGLAKWKLKHSLSHKYT